MRLTSDQWAANNVAVTYFIQMLDDFSAHIKESFVDVSSVFGRCLDVRQLEGLGQLADGCIVNDSVRRVIGFIS